MRRLAVVGVLAIVVAACGSDRGDDPTASGSGNGGDGGQASDDGGSGDDGPVTFGDLDSPCGPAEEGDEATTSTNDQGVTDDQIVIGYGDDAGFPQSPGLNHQTSDAVKAMIAWCNEQGGINGREVVGNYYDAAITEVTNAVTQACSEVFMLVGEAWSLDSAQEEARQGCDLPMVPTYTVSAEAANAPLMVQPVPNPVDRWTVGAAAQLADMFPEEVQNAAVMYGNYSATIDTKDKVLEAYPAVGWEFLDCPQEYNIQGETDWRPFVQSLEDCGAEAVYYSGSPYPNFENMLDAAAQEGYEPIWLVETNSYDQAFAEWNTNGHGDNVYIRTAYTPFEQAEDNQATQDYLEIVEADGGDTSQLGQQSASAFLLWATGADACGADLSRDCVMEQLSQVDSWTGGGMHAETNPAENLPPECSMVLKLDGGEFIQVSPEEQGEFSCSPDHVQPVSGRVVQQAELGEDRVSTKYQ